MSRNTKLLGTVSVLATLAAGPAAADTLMGFAGIADAFYANTSFGGDSGISDDSLNTFGLGAAVAFPVDEIPGLNWELNASYASTSGNDHSSITWNLGGSLFLAYPGSRTGININYQTLTDYGSLTNGGVFTEWYFGNITAQAKGGWLWGGGTPAAGRGNYLGAGLAGYFVPNLAISGAVSWADLVTSATQGFPCYGATCGRRDLTHTDFGIEAEFLVSETFPVSVYGGYQYEKVKISENVSNPYLVDDSYNTNTFYIGLRLYMGGAGTLIEHHRNGNLHKFLRGANGLAPF
jgi:hypothetical protein